MYRAVRQNPPVEIQIMLRSCPCRYLEHERLLMVVEAGSLSERDLDHTAGAALAEHLQVCLL